MTTPIQSRNTALLKEYAADLVADIIRRREESNTAPFVALLSEVKNTATDDLTECLRELCREKVLLARNGLNGVMLAFNPPSCEHKIKDA